MSSYVKSPEHELYVGFIKAKKEGVEQAADFLLGNDLFKRKFPDLDRPMVISSVKSGHMELALHNLNPAEFSEMHNYALPSSPFIQAQDNNQEQKQGRGMKHS